MVKSKILILCEGDQDKKFLNLFYKNYLKIDSNTVEVKALGNKSNFFKDESYTQIKKQIEIGMFYGVLFVLDSDFEKNDTTYGGYENTENNIKKTIKKLDIDTISDYFISCDPSTKKGNLEHLILSTIDKSKKDCIETLIDCIDSMETHENKKIVLTGYETIFKEAPYNFDHQNFEELKNKIISMAK